MDIEFDRYLNQSIRDMTQFVEDEEQWDNEDSNINFNGER